MTGNVGGNIPIFYGVFAFFLGSYQSFIMDKSMLKKLYGEIKARDLESAVDGIMNIDTEKILDQMPVEGAKKAF